MSSSNKILFYGVLVLLALRQHFHFRMLSVMEKKLDELFNLLSKLIFQGERDGST